MNSHSINSKSIFQTNAKGLTFLIVIPILGLIAPYLRGIKIETSLVLIFLVFIFFFIIPSLYLFITFYSLNKTTILTVDKTLDKITIRDNHRMIENRISLLSSIDRVVSVYYKNKIDNGTRRPTPWTGYGFVRLTFENGDSYVITSLIINPFDFPLEVNNTYYKFFPYANSDTSSNIDYLREMEEKKREMINFFKSKFEKLSEERFRSKIKERDSLSEEAQIAIDEIAEERRAKLN